VKLACTLHRMLPSASCQGVGVLKLGVFRGSITWPIVPPVNASYTALRPCPHDSEPVWLAGPSPYDSFIRYILPACPVRSASRSLKVLATALKEHGAYAPDVGAATRCLRTGCWRCDTVLTHRVLALRHVTPKWDAAGKPAPLVWLAKVNAL